MRPTPYPHPHEIDKRAYLYTKQHIDSHKSENNYFKCTSAFSDNGFINEDLAHYLLQYAQSIFPCVFYARLISCSKYLQPAFLTCVTKCRLKVATLYRIVRQCLFICVHKNLEVYIFVLRSTAIHVVSLVIVANGRSTSAVHQTYRREMLKMSLNHVNPSSDRGSKT